ncbi:hypothetical protein C8Q80DRAFT_198319 [Daedaleopsis nitida]|nr:hypothetical protein C8Q80DRAFT_198319 [Daedaleopsis nitida]
MITSTAANMAAIPIECTIYGIFLVLSMTSLVLLARRRDFPSRNSPGMRTNSKRRLCGVWFASARDMCKSPLLIANILLMLTVTAHWIMGIQRLFIGEVTLGGGQAAVAFYTELKDKTDVARITVLFVVMLIGDAVITYRTWLVWGRSTPIIIVPALTISASITTGIGLLRACGASSADKSLFDTTIKRWVTAYCIAFLCTNLYGTITIAYRIWSTNRLLRSRIFAGEGDLTSTLAIFIESAAMSTAWAVMFLVLYTTNSALEVLGPGCGPAVIGVAFMLITVRVGLGWGHNSTPVTSGVETARFAIPGRSRVQFNTVENSFPMRSFAVEVHQTRTVDSERDADGSARGHGVVLREEMKKPDAVAFMQ